MSLPIGDWERDGQRLEIFVLLVPKASLGMKAKDEIKRSKDYYFGEAIAPVYQEARDRAIRDVAEKIIVHVKISTENQSEESNLQVNEYTKSVIETYSIATFRNLQEIREPVNNRMSVFVYIHKNDLAQMFDERKALIHDMYRQALASEQNANIGNALKYLYYAMILMYSLPDERMEYNDIAFHMELPKKIREIMQEIGFSLTSRRDISESEQQLILSMNYQNKPIQYLRFHFWDGSNQIYIEGKDGKAVISLFGATRELRELRLCPDFMYYEQRNEFKAVQDLWDLVKKPDFSHTNLVDLCEIKTVTKEELPSMEVIQENRDVDKIITKETNKFLDVIRSNDANQIKKAYPKDAYLQEQIRCLFEYNNLKIVETDTELEISPTFDGWEVRGIPVTTFYPTLNKQTTDKLVLNFDKKGVLNDIQFTVFDGMYQEAVAGIENEEELLRRKVLIKFIEKYRSSFLYRDLSTLETMFSDEAVIIVGRVLKKAPSQKNYEYRAFGDQPDIEYVTYTKKVYLQNLKNMFSKNEDIYLGYNTFKVVTKNNAPGVYAVSMRQNHSSTGYSDEGYLFLLIDFNEPEPKIYVRSWQPGEWSNDKMIEMSNFRLN
jgi:hypothetical protein